MSAWLVSIIDGALTGLGLYLLVRLRMYLGPIAGQRFGIWGRGAVWLLLLSGMVVLAEVNLIWLQDRLEQVHASGIRWHYEVAYALTVLLVGLVLVGRRVLRRRLSPGDQPGDRRTEDTCYPGKSR